MFPTACAVNPKKYFEEFESKKTNKKPKGLGREPWGWNSKTMQKE